MRAGGSISQIENNHTPPPESNYESNTSSEEDNYLVNEAPRRSKRPKIAKSFGDDFIVYLVDDVPNTFHKLMHLQM